VIDGSRDPIASRRFDDLLEEAQIVVEPVTESQAKIAREAYRDFGRGSGHPAKLNFGDCFAYALAKVAGEPGAPGSRSVPGSNKPRLDDSPSAFDG
jgi:ribonuclease VapC